LGMFTAEIAKRAEEIRGGKMMKCEECASLWTDYRVASIGRRSLLLSH
jgi:hypothetical protein